MSLSSALGVSQAIASARVDPIQQRELFETEELELLPSKVAETYGPQPGALADELVEREEDI